MVFALGLAMILACPGQVQAQAAPQQVAAAPQREVYPRDLMTVNERFEMWRQMRAAKTSDEKIELWAAKRAELEKRAAERGVKLVEMGPMMMGNHQGSQERDNRMMSMGHGSPHPPAGR